MIEGNGRLISMSEVFTRGVKRLGDFVYLRD
jgi:hypothetical protein